MIFPYGIDNYEENTPARIITEISEGSGSLYRESISAGEINYRDYDKTFILGMNVDLYKAGIRIAVERLLYPYRLSEQRLNTKTLSSKIFVRRLSCLPNPAGPAT